MKTRHVCVVALLGLGSFALESCSSDSTSFTPVEDGGEGGDARGKGGSGASAGKGGSGASSGKGGSGASSGQGISGSAGGGNAAGASGAAQGGGRAGGDGGQSSGVSGDGGGGEAGSDGNGGGGGETVGAGQTGDGGVSGSGGSVAGAGGSVAGAGGEGGGDAGFAGEGGSDAGAGGRGTPEELKHCAYECSTDDDCASPGVITYVCDPVTRRCGAPDLTCAEHRDCVPFASSWTIACEKDEECPSAADVCVDVGEAGRCARSYAEDTSCPLPDQVPVPRAKFGDLQVVVQVCGRTNGRCSEGMCFLGCTGPGDCGQGDGDSCDVESGRCTCLADNECTSGAVSHCNPRTHRCDECGSDFDCFLDVSRDHCVDGRCGCSSENVCAEWVFPAATPVCE